MKVQLTPTQPRILPDRDEVKNWYVDQKFKIDIEFDDGKLLEIHVSKGYRFDGHSVPFPMTLFFPQAAGTDLYASLVHDALIDFEMMMRVPRKLQDDIYGVLMSDPLYMTSEFRTKWMTWAVKRNGYKKYTKKGDYRGEMKPKTIIKINVKTYE